MAEENQVVEGALRNLEEAIRIGRTDVIVRTIDIAAKHLSDGQAGVANRILNHPLADGSTCLHLAVSLGHTDAIRALLRAGADSALRNSAGKTAFELAMTEQLIVPFTLHATEAIAVGNIDVVGQVLAAGLSVNYANPADSKNTLMHWAGRCGSLSTVQFLRAHQGQLNVVNAEGLAPLHLAVQRWSVPVVQFMVENGADPRQAITSGPLVGKTAMDIVPIGHTWPELELASGSSEADSHTGSAATRAAPMGLDFGGSVKGEPMAVDDSPDTNPLRMLWPPPSLVRCVQGAGFKLTESLQASFHIGDSTESFSTAAAVFNNALAAYNQVQLKVVLCILPPDGELPEGQLIFSVNSDFFTTTESYNLTVLEDKIILQASDLAGLWYGLQTLFQVILISKDRTLPALYIRDWPDLKYRGFMVDLMQGCIPTLDTLQWVITTMSKLKMNMLQLRMGASSFAYVGLEGLWTEEASYTTGDLLALSDFAERHFVKLVPHQDTLALAVTVLNRTSGGTKHTVEDISGVVSSLHRELFACFPNSTSAHVGLDQPPTSATASSPTGSPSSSSSEDFESLLWAMHSSCRLHRRYMQVWGSELQVCQNILSELPPSVIVMQPLGQFSMEDNAPFCREIVQRGANLIVCPDSLAKDSVGGRPHASMAQLVEIAHCAAHYRAAGMLLTDFADLGHIHPLVASLVPMLAAACVSWRTGVSLAHLDEHLPDVINVFVLEDESKAAGQLLLDVELVHAALLYSPPGGRPSPQMGRARSLSSAANGSAAADSSRPGPAASSSAAGLGSSSVSWWRPAISGIAFRPETLTMPQFTAETVQSALREVRHCQAVLANLQMHCSQATAILSELSFIVELFMYVCRAIKQMVLNNKASGNAAEALRSLSVTSRTDLANRLISVTQLFQEAWNCRNLPGWVAKSTQLFQRTLVLLQEGT